MRSLVHSQSQFSIDRLTSTEKDQMAKKKKACRFGKISRGRKKGHCRKQRKTRRK